MKTLLSTRLALAGTLALFSHTALAQTWQTVDDFQVVSNHVAEPYAMTVDAQGSIYVAGMYQNGELGFRNGLVRRSTDQGASWTTIEDYGYPDPTNHVVVFTAIGLDAHQNLYAVGLTGLGAADASDRLVVRKSADGGATWATTLDFAAPKALNGTATIGSPAFAADAAGAIYVSVVYNAGAFILKSTDAGGTWISWNAGAWVRGMAITSSGLFAAQALGGPWGMVKKSLNAGATWTTVDSYTPPGFNGTGNLEALCADWTGNLYVGGFANINVTTKKTTTTTYNWIVRKGTNGGATWNTQVVIPTGGNCMLNGLDADPVGNVYAVGLVDDTTGHHRWIVEKGANQGASWTLVDNYGPLLTAFATAVTCDAAGGVYVCGLALLPSGTQGHWVVRKQVGP
ncbi:MAG: exo-alpha-sialidase [Verrucomicrobia bacterium]|nr:exo-alpha-sialidase [Verrucomicrobiota bacterium]